MRLDEMTELLRRQSAADNGEVAALAGSPHAYVVQEEDMGTLRLLILQAALKEKRVLESKG